MPANSNAHKVIHNHGQRGYRFHYTFPAPGRYFLEFFAHDSSRPQLRDQHVLEVQVDHGPDHFQVNFVEPENNHEYHPPNGQQAVNFRAHALHGTAPYHYTLTIHNRHTNHHEVFEHDGNEIFTHPHTLAPGEYRAVIHAKDHEGEEDDDEVEFSVIPNGQTNGNPEILAIFPNAPQQSHRKRNPAEPVPFRAVVHNGILPIRFSVLIRKENENFQRYKIGNNDIVTITDDRLGPANGREQKFGIILPEGNYEVVFAAADSAHPAHQGHSVPRKFKVGDPPARENLNPQGFRVYTNENATGAGGSLQSLDLVSNNEAVFSVVNEAPAPSEPMAWRAVTADRRILTLDHNGNDDPGGIIRGGDSPQVVKVKKVQRTRQADPTVRVYIGSQRGDKPITRQQLVNAIQGRKRGSRIHITVITYKVR